MNVSKGLVFLLLSVLLSSGCVSYTERLPYRPHLMPQDDGVWAEVKREFGWQPSHKTKKKKERPASLYARMARSVQGWFTADERPLGPDIHPHHWQRINQEYEQEQKKLGLY